MTNAPDLWPAMDRTTPTARAWIDLWELLDHDTWTPLPLAMAQVLDANPRVLRKTIDNLIRKARSQRLIERRGGYSHKTGRDTREIRRHQSLLDDLTAPADPPTTSPPTPATPSAPPRTDQPTGDPHG